MAQGTSAAPIPFRPFGKHADVQISALGFGGHDFPFDTVQMPLNCLDATFRSFEQRVLPDATRRGAAGLGMKSLGGSGELVKFGAATPDVALRYAMSLPVATTISGVDSMDVLAQNLEIAQGFQPMKPAEMQASRERCRPLAADGRYEPFKTTKMYDAKVGREQHHYPVTEQLPA